MTEAKEKKKPGRKPASAKASTPRPVKKVVLMPGGKYVNMPVNQVTDLWVLLWNLKPSRVNTLEPQQVEAILKRCTKLLKENGWQIPPM